MIPFWAHPGRCLVAPADGQPAAVVAALEPGLQSALGLAGELAGEVACAQISIDALLALDEARATYRPAARFPTVKVDVALSLPEEMSAGSARDAPHQRHRTESSPPPVHSC